MTVGFNWHWISWCQKFNWSVYSYTVTEYAQNVMLRSSANSIIASLDRHWWSVYLSCEVQLHVRWLLYVTSVARLYIRYYVLLVVSCLRTLKQADAMSGFCLPRPSNTLDPFLKQRFITHFKMIFVSVRSSSINQWRNFPLQLRTFDCPRILAFSTSRTFLCDFL